MDRNENGYPNGSVGGVTDMNGTTGGNMGGCGGGCGNGCGNGCGGGCGGNNGMGNGNNGTGNGTVGGVQNNHTCGGTGTCLDRMPLAYVYAPDQVFRMLYSANDALRHGTLFEELYKPMEVYGRE